MRPLFAAIPGVDRPEGPEGLVERLFVLVHGVKVPAGDDVPLPTEVVRGPPRPMRLPTAALHAPPVGSPVPIRLMVEAERREDDDLLPGHAHCVLQQALALRPPQMLDDVQPNHGIDRAIGHQREHAFPGGIEEDEPGIVADLLAELHDVRLERFDADVDCRGKNRLWTNTRADVYDDARVLEIRANRVVGVSLGARDPLDLAPNTVRSAVGMGSPKADQSA
jgi:hypothetical protein